MGNLDWLKRMENGTIGEARTKEIIIDRFWILERSVDINGADFIIQRRLPGQHISDNDPPKMGVVQAKYIQDKNTDIYIKYDYVMRYGNQPRDEFFLIIHTGREDSKKAYFLSSQQINNFTTTIRNGEKHFYISGTKLFENDEEYLIKSYKAMNDYIENSLIRSEYARNRGSLTSFLSNKKLIHPGDIEFKYTHSIYSRYEIPRMLFNIKKNAISLREELQMLVYDLTEIIDETDALKVVKKAEELNGIINYNEDICFNASGIVCGEENLETVEEYLNNYEKLNSNNKLNFFNLIKSKLEDEFLKQIDHVKIGRKLNSATDFRIIPYDSCIKIHIQYNEADNSIEVNTELIKIKHSNGEEMVEVINSSSANIQIIFRWGISGDLSNRNTLEQNAKNATWLISQVIDDILIADLTK